MNLNVIGNKRSGVAVMEPFTLKKKPRCQMAVLPANDWYPHQCERAAVYFEPHHPAPHTYARVERTKVARHYPGGWDGVFPYAEDVLFGYCNQHSMTKNHQEQDKKEDQQRRAREARAEATNRREIRDKLFLALMQALEHGDDIDVKFAQGRLKEAGFKLADFRLER